MAVIEGKNTNGVCVFVCVWRFVVRFQGQTRAPNATNAAPSAAQQPHARPRPRRAASSWHGDAHALVNPRAVRGSYAPALAMYIPGAF